MLKDSLCIAVLEAGYTRTDYKTNKLQRN